MKRLKQTQEVPAGHIIHDDHSHEVINISKAEKWSCSHHRGMYFRLSNHFHNFY